MADESITNLHPIITQLRRERQKRYTQPQMAGLIGTSRGNISDWEYGRYSPNLANLTAWARALGFDLALVPITGETHPATTPSGLTSCPYVMWDGPFRYRCGKGAIDGVCGTHGRFRDSEEAGRG